MVFVQRTALKWIVACLGLVIAFLGGVVDNRGGLGIGTVFVIFGLLLWVLLSGSSALFLSVVP